MAITLNGFWSAQEKTSDTTMPSVPTGVTVVNVLPGDTLFAFFAFDNLTNTTPTITGVSRTSGSLNLASVWTRISEFNSPQAAAAGGVRGELWRANITTAVGAGTVDMIGSLSAAVTAKAALLLHFSGVGVLDSMGVSTGANIADSAVAGDLLIAFNGTESNASQAFSGVNVGGFTAVTANGTTGGSGVTNVWANSTYQIATGALSPQVGAAVTDGGVIFGVFKPAPDPVLTQAAYRFYAEGSESGSTALAAQDTAPTVDTSGGDVPLQLRLRVQEGNVGLVRATDDFALQWEKNASGTWANVVTGGEVLSDGYDSANQSSTETFAVVGNAVGQSFLGDGRSLTRARFWLQRLGSPTGTLRAYLFAHTGTFGDTGTGTSTLLAFSTTILDLSTVGTSFGWHSFDFAGTYTLAAGTPYVIVVSQQSGTTDGSNQIQVGIDNTTPAHVGSRSMRQSGTWSAVSGVDAVFEVYTSVIVSTVIPYDSPSLDNTAPTTNRLTGGSGSFVAGDIAEDGVCNDFGWSQSNYTEFLYGFKLVAADLAPSDTLRFRVLRNGAVLNTYAQVPTLSIASAGPQVRQVSGIVPVTVGVSGDVTRVPLTLQVSGSVVVTTAASGAATIVAGPVTHQVSGTVAVITAASGAATVYVPPVTHQVSGTVDVVSGTSGAVSLRQPVSGTVAVTTGASGVATGGQGQPPGWEQGAYPVMVRTTVSGAVTVVAGAVTHQVSGVVPVNVGAAGTVSARLQASGSIPVVTTAVGAATRVPINQQVSGSVSVVTTTTGAATRVPIVHQVSGTVPVVTAVVGDATRVPITFLVAGTVPVVTVATGSPILVGGAQQYQVSGAVPVSTAASGAVTARLSASGVVPVVTTAAGTVSSLLPTSGTVPVATAASGAVTVSPKPVSGTVAVVTTVNGAVIAQLPVSGTAAVVTTAAGSISQSLSVSGTVAVVTSASGAISKQQQVSGVVPVNTAASGAVSSRLPVSGVVPVTVNAVGAVTSKQNVSGVVPVVTGTVGNALPPGGTSGTVAVTVGVTGAVTSKQGVSGTPAAVTVGVSGAVTSKQGIAGTIPVTTGVSGAVQINPRGRVDVVTGVSGTVTQVHQVSGSVAVSTGASGVVSAKFPVAGAVPVVTTASGSANFVGGAVTHPVSGTVAVVTTTSGTISAVKPTSGTVAVVTASSGSIARIQSVSGTVAVVTGTSGAATISVKQLQVSGRVDVTTAANGSITAVLRVSGTVVVVTDASGKTLSPGLPPFPCGDLVLTPSGPMMSLVGATPVLTLQMEVDRLPLSGAAEGYPVTKTAERLTLEGVC